MKRFCLLYLVGLCIACFISYMLYACIHPPTIVHFFISVVLGIVFPLSFAIEVDECLSGGEF